MPFLTIDGENKLAQNQSIEGGLKIANFVLANVPDLGSEPDDRIASLPDPSLIVDTLPFTKRGYVNPNQVVYSLVIGSNVGDYDFNWVGLVDEDGVLIAVSHVPTIQKRKNVGGVPGNTITRNFLVKYTGIQQITATLVPVETWQIDFGNRLIGIDERERLANLDIYGHEGFLDDGWKVTGSAGTYSVATGLGYVGGIRAKNVAPQEVITTIFPNEIWLNVSLQGDISDMTAVSELVIDTGPFEDYVDGNGITHYLTKLAEVDAVGDVSEGRLIYENVKQHENKVDPHSQYKSYAELKSAEALSAAIDYVGNYTGSVHWFAAQVSPAGFVKANGAELLIESYPALYAAIGTVFGGDGITTFNVPDLRGEFIRGWDDGRGIDVDRILGSWQVGSAFPGDGDGQNILIPNLNSSDHVEVLGFEPDRPPYPSKGITAKYSYFDGSGVFYGMREFGGANNVSDYARSRPRNIALIAYIKF